MSPGRASRQPRSNFHSISARLTGWLTNPALYAQPSLRYRVPAIRHDQTMKKRGEKNEREESTRLEKCELRNKMLKFAG